MSISPAVEERISQMMQEQRFESVDELLLDALKALEERQHAAMEELADSLERALEEEAYPMTEEVWKRIWANAVADSKLPE